MVGCFLFFLELKFLPVYLLYLQLALVDFHKMGYETHLLGNDGMLHVI